MANPSTVRSVRLFRSGRSQAVRIPREFALPGEEATISRDRAGRLILEAVRMPPVVELLDSWEPPSDQDAMPLIERLEVEPFDL